MGKRPNLEGLLDFLRIPYNKVSDGNELQTLCMFCGKADHLYFNLRERIWICHHCGEAGGYDRLEQGILNWVVDQSHQPTDEVVEFWHNTRGLDWDTIRVAKLGYYGPLQRYTIPYFFEGEIDAKRISNISFRSSLESQEPKYIRLPGVPSATFIPETRGEPEDIRLVVITEGEIDALTAAQSFRGSTVGGDGMRFIGLPGATFINDKLTQAIPRGTRLVAVIDNDAAGRKAGTKLKERFPSIRLLVPGTGKDLNELLVSQGEDAVRALILQTPNVEPTGSGEVPEEYERDSKDRVRGIPSPIYISLPDDQADWLVQDLWMDQALGFIGGEPKTMKSLFTLHLAYAIAEGKPFCSKRVIKPGPVLLFQEEDTDHLIKRRLKTVNGGLGSPNLWLFTPGVTKEHMKLDSDDAMEMLDEAIRQIQPVLVVLDPLANMHSLEDENKSAPMNRMLERLRYLRDLRKTSFMIVHHLRKEGMGDRSRPGQKLRGSGVLHAKAECGLYIDRTGDVLTIEVENKMNPNRTFEVKFTGNTFVYEDETGEGVE